MTSSNGSHPASLSPRQSRGLYLLAFGLCSVLVSVSVAWVDRPVADYYFVHFRDTALALWTSRVLGSLRVVIPIAILWLAGTWGWHHRARTLPAWARTPLIASLSAVLAGSTAILLKYLFGRASIDTYLVQRVYEWRPLRGGNFHMAFPSGMMAVAGAGFMVLWILHPRFRIVSAVVLVALALALIVTNGHWVADIIAGLSLGICVGGMTLPRLEVFVSGLSGSHLSGSKAA